MDAEWNKKVELFNKCVRESFRQSGYDDIEDVVFFGVTNDGYKSVLRFNPDEDHKKPWSLKVEDSEIVFESNDVTDILFDNMLIEDDDYPDDTWESVGNFLDLNIWKDDEEQVRSVALYSMGINLRCGNMETNTDSYIDFRHDKKPTG
jgi:hypothetical protein